MREDLWKILDDIVEELLKESVDPNVISAKLRLNGHLTQDENAIIQSSKDTTEKFFTLATLLKSNSEDVLIRLQQMCIEIDKIDLYKFIKSSLEINENCGHLILTDEDFLSYLDSYGEPLFFDVKDPTKNFVGRELQLKELHELMQRSASKTGIEAKKIAITEKSGAITGLGGIGKTQLALKYVELFRREYGNHIVWLNAETEWTLRDSFQRVAHLLEVNTKNNNGVEKDTSVIAKEVYEHFMKVKCLFVFDNADKTIPEELYPSGPQYKINILITSRCQLWGKIQMYQLGNFTLEEAMKFIQKVLQIGDGEGEQKDIELLAKTLHCFPLAITQATAYINETKETMEMVGSTFTVADYVEMYKEKKEDLLNFKFFTDFGTEYSQTTYTTWLITINKIQESKNGGKLPLTILNLCSYLASQNIDTKIFWKLGNNLEVGSAIKILKQYSMVNLENNMISIHPLIQEVTKLNLKQKNIEEETFTLGSVLINIRFLQLMSLQAYDQIRQLLEHMEMILQAVKAWLQNNPSDRKRIEQTIIRILLKIMFHGYFEISESRQKKLILEQLLDIETEEHGPDHFQVATILMNLGCAYGDLGDNEKMKSLLERSLAIDEKHYGLDHFQVAVTLSNLGCAYGELGDHKKKKTLLKRSLTIKEKYYGLDHFQIATTLTNLGCAYGDLGDHEKEKTLLERSLAIKENHYGLDHFQVAITLANLGCAYGNLGDHEKMKTLLERSLAIIEKHYGPDHYQVAITLTNLGCAYGTLGNHEKKKTLLERSLTIKEKYYGLDHFQVAFTLANLGCAYGALGDHEKKKTLLERSLAIFEKHYGQDHFKVAITLTNLGCAYGDLGDDEKKKTLLERSLTIQEKHYGFDHFEVAITLANLGCAYGALGDHEKKKTLLERSLAIYEKYYGPDHFEVAIILKNLGSAYGALGDHEKKKTVLERALEIKEKHYGNVLITLKNLFDAYSKLEKNL